MDVIERIREAVDADGRSRRRIAKDSGVDEAALSRLMSGERGLGVRSLARLADTLGLELTLVPKAKPKPEGPKGRR